MLSMGVEQKGIEGFDALLKQLGELNTRFRGVELIGGRDGDVSNAEIVENLIEDDRDFFSPDSDLAEKVAVAFAEEAEKRMEAAAKSGRGAPSDDTIAAASLMAAMRAYMAAVVERIEQQRTVNGGSPRALTEAYAKYKISKFGFDIPIGKATGQLLQALTPGGASAGKIQLIRK